MVLIPEAELPDKGGSHALMEVSCGQFLVSLDAAGSQLPGLEKDLGTSSKCPICLFPLITGLNLLKAIRLTVGRGGSKNRRGVLESGRLQAFWEVMLEGACC